MALPNEVVSQICDLGVQSCADVAGLWKSGQACIDELETAMRTSFSDGLAAQVRGFWIAAWREAKVRREAQVKTVVQERLSSVPTGASSSSSRVVTLKPPPVSNRIKAMQPVGGAGGFAVLSGPAGPDPFSKEELARQAKLEVMFELALKYVLDLQSLGVTTAQLEDPLQWRGVRDATMVGAARLSVHRLGALISSFRRWVKFCTENDIDAKAPTPLQLGQFLKLVARGGPTASASMHAALKWWAANLGADFQVDHWVVRPYRFNAAAHSGRQAPELEPWEAANLLLLLTRMCGTHKVLAAMVLMASFSCIRYEHLQRSSYVEARSGWLECRCRQGKSRQRGSRPPYDWAMPDVVFRGCSLGALLEDFYRNMADPEATFMVPAVSLEAADLWELTESTSFHGGRPMSRARFLEVFRGLLVQVGVPVEVAQASTYNRTRRFLPTLANCMKLSPEHLQAIGNWTELPEGGHGDPARQRSKAVMSMGLHYAGGKLGRSASTKMKCVARFLELMQSKLTMSSLTEDGYLPRDSWNWGEFAAIHHDWDESAVEPAVVADQVEVADGALDVELPVVAESPTSPISSSSSTSSSASDISAEGMDLVGILPDESAVDDMVWLRQGRKIHLVREEPEQGHPIPWCRDKAFAQEPQQRGRGFTQSAHTAFCQRCLSRMPRGLYTALADYNGWMH